MKYDLSNSLISSYQRYQELFLKGSTRTAEENTEFNNLQTTLNPYLITALDFNNKIDKDDYIKTPEYKVTGGTNTAYTLLLDIPISTLKDGDGFIIKAHLASGSNPTLKVSNAAAVSIVKPNGNPARLYKDAIYSVRYNGTNFILQGEGGEGTAQPEHVLTGYTFTNDDDVKTGSMPNRGAVTQTITTQNGQYIVPAGYHNGLGKVTVNITNLSSGYIRKNINVGGIVGTYAPGISVVSSNTFTGYVARDDYETMSLGISGKNVALVWGGGVLLYSNIPGITAQSSTNVGGLNYPLWLNVSSVTSSYVDFRLSNNNDSGSNYEFTAKAVGYVY